MAASHYAKTDIQVETVILCIILLGFQAGSVTNECIINGTLSTSSDWYGYLFQETLGQNNARLQFQISYPVTQCCANLLLYYGDQMKNVTQNMTCEQKEAVLPQSNNQIMALDDTNFAGCIVSNDTNNKTMYVCLGERWFRSSQPAACGS